MLAISTFLKDTVTESLRKPLQPAGFFAAAVFLILNLWFVYPSLLASGVPFAVVVRDLSDAWKLALATAAALLLAYVLLSLNGAILRIFTGELWANSPWIAQQLRNVQLRARQRRQADIPTGPGSAARALQATWDLTTLFPERADAIAPTALGNVMAATADALWQRYRIEMAALWPHMETVIANLQTPLASRLDNQKATLDFLLNLTVVLVAFAVEHLALQFTWLRGAPNPGLIPLLLLAAWLLYRVAVQQARSWGDTVQMAFDLYRGKLRETLAVREFTSPDDECTAWEAVSRWLLWGTPQPAADLFTNAEPAPEPSMVEVVSTANVTVTIRDALATRSSTSADASGLPRFTHGGGIDYTLLISTADSDGRPQVVRGAYVIIADQRLQGIAAPPAPDPPGDARLLPAPTPTATIIPSGHSGWPDQLVWHIPRLARGSGLLLRYWLPTWQVTAQLTGNPAGSTAKQQLTGTVTTTSSGSIEYTFDVTVATGNTVTDAGLDVTDPRIGPSIDLTRATVLDAPGGVRRLDPKREPPGSVVSWSLGSLTAGTTRLSYRAKAPSTTR